MRKTIAVFRRFNGFLDKNGSLIPHWLFSWLKTPEKGLKRGLKLCIIYIIKWIPNNVYFLMSFDTIPIIVPAEVKITPINRSINPIFIFYCF